MSRGREPAIWERFCTAPRQWDHIIWAFCKWGMTFMLLPKIWRDNDESMDLGGVLQPAWRGMTVPGMIATSISCKQWSYSKKLQPVMTGNHTARGFLHIWEDVFFFFPNGQIIILQTASSIMWSLKMGNEAPRLDDCNEDLTVSWLKLLGTVYIPPVTCRCKDHCNTFWCLGVPN